MDGVFKTYHKQGAHTGLDFDGYVGVMPSGAEDPSKVNALVTEHDGEPGDSGGIVYFPSDVDDDGVEEAFVCGEVIRGQNCDEDSDACFDEIVSITAGTIEDRLNGTFF